MFARTPSNYAEKGVQTCAGDLVAESSEQQQRVLWGIVLTAQTVALFLAVLAVAALTGFAVLSWLEHHG